MKIPARAAAFGLALALPASAVETAKDFKTAPIVDLRLAPISQGLLALPTVGAPNLGVGALPDLHALDALQPINTVPIAPTARTATLQTVQKFSAPAADKASISGTLTRFSDNLAKDQAQSGGANASALQGKFFDNVFALSKDDAIPHAEGVTQIAKEIEEPPELLRAHGVQGTVAIYGSARIPSPDQAQAQYKDAITKYGRKPKTGEGREALKAARQAIKNSQYYELARRFGQLVARGGQGKIAVITGGGPGIMEGANRGAFEAGGPSVGFNIKLPHEQDPNPYLTPGLSFDFEHFASRKMNLRHGALAMVYFPGGFGTMDEFFEVITLMQTGKIARRPIVLVGEKSYWDQILDFKAFAKMGMISKEDLKLFRFAETAEQAWAIVREQRRN